MRSLFVSALAAAGLVGGLLTACTGDIGDSDPGSSSSSSSSSGNPVEQAIEPAPGGLRKLTGRQYVNSIRALLGDAAGDKADELVAAADPPFDSQVEGMEAIGAAQLSLSPTSVDQLESFASDIAGLVVSDAAALAKLVPCDATGPSDAACHEKFVTAFGRLAFRRPLTKDEVALFVKVAQGAATHPDVQSFDQGVFYALTAILQSPYFLYIVELGDEASPDPAKRHLTDLELGTRISFFLLEQTPTAAVLDKIENDGLDTDDKVRALATSLVGQPGAKAALASFYSEIYRLRELTSEVAKDPAKFPSWSPALAESMKQETLKLIDDIVWKRNSDMRELFDANFTFVNADLAALYGVSAPATEWGKVTLPAVQRRAGFLGQAAFAARQSTPSRNSPTRRGLFIQSMLLCNEIPPPPPGVNTQLPDDDPGTPQTLKQKLQKHEEEAQCGACHKLMDPFGFALENYDAIGAFRTTDNGLPIDSTAEVDGIGKFDSAKTLGALLHDDPRGAGCIIRTVFRNSMGHKETPGEKPAVDALEKAFADAEYRMQDLLVEIVASPAFRLVGEPK